MKQNEEHSQECDMECRVCNRSPDRGSLVVIENNLLTIVTLLALVHLEMESRDKDLPISQNILRRSVI